MTQWIITSSILIAVVLVIRAAAGDKLSARLRYALWGLVLLRLLVPVSIGESSLSVQNWLPEKEPAAVQSTQPVDLDVYASSDSQEILQETPPVQGGEGTVEVKKTIAVLPLVYVLGCTLVGAVFLLSNLRFALRLRRSRSFVARKTLPVYESAAIETPCMFGLLRPAVYMTPEVLTDKTAQAHVLAHELTHYRHGDHLWSLLRCVCLAVHWYNPLVWAAAIASQKDGELACDEGALRRLGREERASYARTLLNLTCVGYRGILTAATSMTGSESDLKARIKRIVKNPKMTVTALIGVLVVAALAAVMLFSGAAAPKIEGVWRMDVEILGEGVSEDDTAYMEYEFYAGRGLCTNCVNGEIRAAEHFTYTLSGDAVTLEFPEIGPIRDYTWAVEGDTLTLSGDRGDLHLTKVQREQSDFLPEGYWEVQDVVFTSPEDSELAELTDTQKAQLLALLRQTEVTEKRNEPLTAEPYMCTVILTNGTESIHLSIASGMGSDADGDNLSLSNGAEIDAWVSSLTFAEKFNPNMETSGFVPADMVGIVDARMIVYGKAFHAVDAQLGFDAKAEKLAFLEELLSTAVDMGYPTACPFEGYLEVTLSDGRVLAVVPALDSCSAFMIGDTCYEYGNQFAYDDEGSYDNTELLAVFGLNHDMLMELWETTFESVQGEAIGGLTDQGDVIRVQNDVMEPTILTDSDRELLMAMLAEGIYEPVEEGAETDFAETYYIVLCGADYGFPDVVTVSDNGSVYIDGLRYVPHNMDRILDLLDAHYKELSITQEGDDAEISEQDINAAEALARSHYEGWRSEDYCIRMDVILSDVDEAESVRLRTMYEEFQEGWTAEYLAKNFVTVRVQYDCELDHEKTFLDDGLRTQYVLLVRDNENAPWQIWDFSNV